MDEDDLYQLLPEFACTPGCTECCRTSAMPSRNRVEEERIRRFLMARGREVKEPVGIPCPYLGDTGCTIHPVRPLICRLYGTSPSYLCKMGVRPVQLLHEDEEADIFRRYLALSSSSLT